MAGITGVLGADFTSFLNAVEKAQVSLRSFETGSAKVESALNKMANSFSGQKIISEATTLTKAVDSIGGASTLTAKEMAKVNSTLTEALAKYKALGVSAPPAMQDLANATKNTDHASGGFMQSLGKMNGLLGAMGIGLSVGAIVSFGKALIAGADALNDLSAKTGVSLDQLQRWAFVGAQAGVSTDEFADASFKLGVKLAGGSGSVRDAVEKLGLSYEALRKQSPDEQFNSIVAALERMEDPQERNRLGVELFGKTFATIAPAVAKGYTEMAKQAQVSSDTQIKAIGQAVDAWDRFYANQKTNITSALGDAVIRFQTFANLTLGQQAKVVAASFVGVDAMKKYADAVKAQAAAASASVPGQQRQTVATTDYTAVLAKAKGEVSHLTAAQIAGIAAAQRLGTSTEDISNAYGISEGALRLLKEQTTKHAQETTKATTAITKVKEEVEKLLPSQNSWALGIGQLNDRIPDLSTHIDEMREAFEALQEWVAPLASVDLPALNKQIALLPNVLPQGTQAIEDATAAEESATQATSDWSETLSTLSNDFVQMAQIGGDSFGEVARVAGMVVKSVEMVNRAIDQLNKAAAEGGDSTGASLNAAATGFMASYTAVLSLLQAMDEASTKATNLAAKTERLAKLQQHWNTDITFTDELYQALSTSGGALVKTIEELGGVANLTTEQFEKLGEQMALALVNMQDDQNRKKSMEELNALLADMGRVALDSGKLVSQTFIDLVKQAKELGIEVAGVNELIVGQLGGAAEGMNALLTGLSKGLGDSFTVTAEQGAGLAAATAATFAEMIERGMSYKEALDKLKPSIDILTETLKKSGVDGGAAFDFLTEMARIAGDEFMGPLSDAITGANKALKGLHNSGILNQTMFTGLEQSAMLAYQKIIDGGGDGNAALMMMQPTLQTLWAMQRDFGYIVDDATQALLDEAEASGKVGDKHRPVAEQMLLATQAIERAVTALAKVMGADLPESAERGAERVSKALKGIQGPPPMDAPWAHWGEAPDLVDVPGASTGAFVTDRGLQHFARGGTVLNFRPRGSDTVPAMLTPGEMVLTPAQQQRLLNGGGGVDNAAVVAALDAVLSELQTQRRDFPRALATATTSATLRKRRSA